MSQVRSTAVEATAEACESLPRAAQLPLLAENAALLSNRIRSLAAKGVSTIELAPEHRAMWDPTVHFSHEYLDHVKRSCIAAAKEAEIRLEWRITNVAQFDFRALDADPDAVSRLRRLPASNITDYERLLNRLHSTLEVALGDQAIALVVTKGDHRLLPATLDAWHFPRGADGEWAGYHPADRPEAIEQLERWRGAGATHLILPRTVFWWFRHYRRLVEHLTTRYATVVEDPRTCVVFDLRSKPAPNAGEAQQTGAHRVPAGQPGSGAPKDRSQRGIGLKKGPSEADVRRRAVMSLDQRIATESQNLSKREEALIAGRTVLPGPYEAHVGFSNFCNMSCIMCWNGANPPVRRMSPSLLEKFANEFGPSLSVITPYDGSEPLIASWEETRKLAEDYRLELCLTTNVQFLDEAKFREVERVTETLFLSIDSHVPELFAKIRPRSKPDRVFHNLRTTARLARETGLECLANVVFMTENAPMLPETVAYLADVGIESVHVLQLLDVNGQSGLSDPLLHFSHDYVDWIRQRCVDMARQKRIRLHWDVAGGENYDFRGPRAVRPTPRKVRYDHWTWRMKHYVPGYCRYVYDRLRVTINGAVAPCSYSVDGQLELGNLAEQTFSEIWNGPRAQDLRRAHTTWDYPANCVTCRLKDPIGPAQDMPFADSFHATIGHHPRTVERTLAPLEPAHMTRTADPPMFRVACDDEDIVSYCLVLGLGGETDHVMVHSPQPSARSGDVVEFDLADRWEWLRPNVGYWWLIFGFTSDAELPQRVVRSSEIRCVIRHLPIPRLEGSGLQYPDDEHSPSIDLGSAKELGWTEQDRLPERPRIVRRPGF